MNIHSDGQDKQDTPSAEPLPHTLTHQVEEEALEQTVASSGVAQERFRRGRIEAESHRISEEVTRQAQERRRQQEETTATERLASSEESTVQKDEAPFLQVPSNLFTGAETLPAPMPLRRVLVPVGDSPMNKRTLPYAAFLASELHSDIFLAYVDASSAAGTPTLSWQSGAQDKQMPAMKKHVSAYFERLRDQIPESIASQISALETGAPSVSDGLLSVESGSNTDLALVALRRHSLANHFSLGTVVDALIQKGSAPVMVIPPHAGATAGHPVKVRHIVVPLDGSVRAEQALAPLLGWLGQIRQDQETRLAVTLLGVAENHAVQAHYQSYLEALRRVLQTLPNCEHVRVQAEVLVRSSVPEALVDAVEQNIFGRTFRSEPTDLVMMATHGRGGLGRWLFGSVAAYVLPRVHVPVLLVHPAFLDV
jgi:nucleotide-binding universal stress UspA family protein